MEALQALREQLAGALHAAQVGLLDYAPDVRAVAGAIVTVDRQGDAVIHRGLLREAEAKALRTLERLRQSFAGEGVEDDPESEDVEPPKAANLSDRLAQRLSAHRTAALRIEVARHPQVALVHGMVQAVLQEHHYGHAQPLGVHLTVKDRLGDLAPDWPESPAVIAQHELQRAWRERLPQDGGELFSALLAMPQEELVQLLAVCGAASVDVVTPRAVRHQPGEELARAVGLDMAAWWKPTAEGYFNYVSKAVILEAVRQFAPEHVTRLSTLKKANIASEAERLADGTGWMPTVFAMGPEPREVQR